MLTCCGASGPGNGGSGGGGNAGNSLSYPGTDGLGGGGGGGGDQGVSKPGGSGVVIIAYTDGFDDLSSVDNALTSNGSTGNTTPNTDRSGYKVYKFTSGTGSIKF
jgi:hypothetical protein